MLCPFYPTWTYTSLWKLRRNKFQVLINKSTWIYYLHSVATCPSTVFWRSRRSEGKGHTRWRRLKKPLESASCNSRPRRHESQLAGSKCLACSISVFRIQLLNQRMDFLIFMCQNDNGMESPASSVIPKLLVSLGHNGYRSFRHFNKCCIMHTQHVRCSEILWKWFKSMLFCHTHASTAFCDVYMK